MVICALVGIVGILHAIEFEFAGARTYTIFGFLPAPTGLDIRLTFGDSTGGFPGSIILGVGGGYERDEVFRDAEGEPLAGGYIDDDIEIERLELYIQPMVSIVPAPESPVSIDLGFRSHLRRNFKYEDAQFSSGEYFTDRDLEGAFVNTIRGGTRYEKVSAPGPHGEIRGLDLSAMIEYGPEFLGNRFYPDGASLPSDYMRINAVGRGYLPVYDAAPDRILNLFNISIAGQVVADLLTGNSVPFHEQAFTRGYIQSKALGKLMRGFEDTSYPALLKLVANTEVRMVGPAFQFAWLVPLLDRFIEMESRWFAPVLSLFVDSGYYAGFRTGGYFAPSDDGISDFLISAGATLGMNLLRIVQVGYTIAIPIQGQRADNASIGHGLAVGFHF